MSPQNSKNGISSSCRTDDVAKITKSQGLNFVLCKFRSILKVELWKVDGTVQAFIKYVKFIFDPVWGEVLREPVEVGGGGLPRLLLRRPLSAPLGGAAEPHHRTLGVQVRGQICFKMNFLTLSPSSVCVNPSVVAPVEGESGLATEELDNVIRLVFLFLEQQHPGLSLGRDYR